MNPACRRTALRRREATPSSFGGVDRGFPRLEGGGQMEEEGLDENDE